MKAKIDFLQEARLIREEKKAIRDSCILNEPYDYMMELLAEDLWE